MLNDVSVFLRNHGGINRHVNHTCHGHSHVGKIPLGPVVGDGDYLISLFKAQFQESKCEMVGSLVVLL